MVTYSGCHLITDAIISEIPELRKFVVGTANLFIKHTSASLSLNEVSVRRTGTPPKLRGFKSVFAAPPPPTRMRIQM